MLPRNAASLAGPLSPPVHRLMLDVMLALLPGSLLLAWAFGPGIIINILAAVALSCALEALSVRLRRRSSREALSDGSIIVAGWLFALALPPWLPLWQLAVGVAAMVWLGKHLYGGLGHNPFNPAMTGYAVLLVSFPVTMTTWPALAGVSAIDLLTLLDIKLWPGSYAHAVAAPGWDAITGATPLDRIRTLERLPDGLSIGVPVELPAGLPDNVARSGPPPPTASQALNELIPGGGFVAANVAFLAGGLFLLWRGVIRWHIPVAVLGSLTLLYVLQMVFSHAPQPALPWALLSGAAILGAFFIATDPVSAATADTGRLIYGSGIGILMFTIREYGGYPEGLAFAVLLMNAAVPAIDHWSARRGRDAG